MCLTKLDQLNIRERIHIAFKCTQNIHKCELQKGHRGDLSILQRIHSKVRLCFLTLYKINPYQKNQFIKSLKNENGKQNVI